MKNQIRQKAAEKVWSDFEKSEDLTAKQLKMFKKYEEMLSEWNKVMNLTAIRGLSEIVSRHFRDSLAFRNFVDLSKVKLIADIGSGAGFPGIPLKIMFPKLGVILIEVTKKKQRFLRTVIDELGLDDVEVCGLDWRTFLRKTEGDVEYFLTRASLEPSELCRMFRPGCFYKNAKLVYWASNEWVPEPNVKKFVLEEFKYKLKRKNRRLVLMGI